MFHLKNGKVLPVMLAAVTALSLSVPAYADTDSELAGARSSQAAAESGLSASQKKIASLESGKTELETYLDDLDTQLDSLSEELGDVSAQLTEKATELETAKGAVSRAQAEADRQYAAMLERIQYMYEAGSKSLMVTLLEADSVTDFLNRASRVMELTEYDRKQLEAYQEAQDVLSERQSDLEAEQAALAGLKQQDESKVSEIRALVAETNAKISEYAADISDETLIATGLQTKIDRQKQRVASLKAQADDEEETRRDAEENSERTDAYAKEDSSSGSSTSAASGSSASAASSSTSVKGTTKTAEKTKEEPASVKEKPESEPEPEEEEEEESESEEKESDSDLEYLGNFKLTAYCPCAKCCGTANNNTASGVKPTAGHTVAMGGIPFGTKLLINGTVYTVEDRGTPYGHVDIFHNTHDEALRFGVKYADVYIVK